MSTQRRSTKQKELIRSIVASLTSHPTAEDVYDLARLTLPDVSLGTIYRNLKILSEEGRLREVKFGREDKSRYDGMLEEHEHFICSECGIVRDIPRTTITIDRKIFDKLIGNATITGYDLSLHGLCEKCSG